MWTTPLLQPSLQRESMSVSNLKSTKSCWTSMAQSISPNWVPMPSWLFPLQFAKQVLLRKVFLSTVTLQTWLEKIRSSYLSLLSMSSMVGLMLATSLLCRSSWFCPLVQRPLERLSRWEQKCTITWKLSSKQNMVRMLPMLEMRVVLHQIFWITTRVLSFWMLLLLRQATKVERTLKLEWMLLPLSSTRTRNMIWTLRQRKTRICLRLLPLMS